MSEGQQKTLIDAWKPVAEMLRQDLFSAVCSTNVKMLRELIKGWSHPNIELVVKAHTIRLEDAQKRTLLHHAKNGTVVDVLLSAGVSINQQDSEGQTASHSAAAGNRFSVVKALIKANADLSIVDHHGRLAVDYATDMHLKHFMYDVAQSSRRKKPAQRISVQPRRP